MEVSDLVLSELREQVALLNLRFASVETNEQEWLSISDAAKASRLSEHTLRAAR